MSEIDDAWKALNKNGFALDYDEDSRPGSLAKAIDYALAAKDDEIGRRDERISELETLVERYSTALRKISWIENREYGSDWEEITEAREIASTALPSTGRNDGT